MQIGDIRTKNTKSNNYFLFNITDLNTNITLN